MKYRDDMRKEGFTLIELLVVIAIIGILSSITIVALNAARQKAKDSRAISSLSQMRSIAAILYSDSEGGYSDLNCTTIGTDCVCTDSNVEQLCEDVYDQNPDANMVMNIGDGKYCIQATLPSGRDFCVDSTGIAGTSPTSCDSTNYDCDTD